MSDVIETLKGWAETFHQDVDALKQLVEAEGAHDEARRIAAAALNYVVTRMDLVPDWNEGIGALDDAMVVRACVALAHGRALGDLPAETEITLGRLGNEAERLPALFGAELADRLRAYCARLAETAVRGRTPAAIVADAAARQALYAEVEEELRKSVPVVVADPADAALRLKAYLEHKLK